MLSKPVECRGCDLVQLGTGFGMEEGTGALGVYILGEALGEQEAREGLPFRPGAPAGSVLERAIKRTGFDRQQFRIGNVVNCQPPQDKLNGAKYELGAIDHCKRHWETRLRKFAPKSIFALGNIPLRSLTGMTGKKRTISALRGYVLESPYGLVVPSLHPAFIRRGKPGYIGLFMFDLMRAVGIAKNGFTAEKVDYTIRPSQDQAEAFLRHVLDNPNLLVTYDIETRESFGQEEDELEWEHTEEPEDTGEAWEARGEVLTKLGTTMTQIQFSTKIGTGIVFPAIDPYMSIAKQIMATENPKAGHNAWRFDNPILRAKYGWKIGGVNHDTRWAFHHIQPDLPANLQTVASIYGMPFPWKHLSDSEPEFYGAADVDAPQRIMAKVIDDMKKRGVYRGYEEHIRKFDRVLVNMSARGIAQDPVRKEAFRGELNELIKASNIGIQARVPADVCSVHPKEGYKKAPKEAVEGAATEHQGKPAIWAIRKFPVLDDQLNETLVDKWVKILPFNANSSDQLMRYMRSKGHKVPWNRKEQKETTAKKELERLAKTTKDDFYLKVIDWRGYGKMLSTYVDGWKAAADGRIHSEFGYGPATGQLNSRGPNVQNAPKHRRDTEKSLVSLADKFRQTLIARPGHRLVELDFHSFHAQTLALECGCPVYMRMAKIDMHSFFTAAGMLKLKKPEQLVAMSDAELQEFFKWHKKSKTLYDGHTFKWIRDKQAKPTVLGYGFGLQAMHLWEMNQEYMPDKKFAQKLIDTLDALFPVPSKWRKEISVRAYKENMLVSRHGYLRWFWDVYHWDSRRGMLVSGDDHEKSIAFLPANDAFGHYRDALNRLEESGWNERARLINNLHDAGLYEIPDEICEEAIYAIKGEMERPSTVLSHPVVAKDGFSVEVDVAISGVGGNWAKKTDAEGNVWNPGGMEDWSPSMGTGVKAA
jgi:uracil-DNA glycosylase family 4